MNYLQFSLAILHFFQTTFDFNPHLLVLLRGIGMSSCAVLYLPCQTTCHVEPRRFGPNDALTIEWNKKTIQRGNCTYNELCNLPTGLFLALAS